MTNHFPDDRKKVNQIVDANKKVELQADIDHFKETEKTRELNSFEKGIKEECERLLNNIENPETMTNS